MTTAWAAVLPHSADCAELLGVAEDLCAAAAVADIVGRALLSHRLVDQAAAVLELRQEALLRGKVLTSVPDL